ncbi:MAG: hypothetical protein WBZ42_03570 [Halobacteriota archaeon]
MSDLSRYWPISGREEINGVTYEWDMIDRGLGTLHYSVNHERLRTVHFKETSDDFKAYLEERAREKANSAQGMYDQLCDRALEICAVGNPREFILNTFKTLHIGDNDTAEGILVGTMNQSIANSKGLQSSVHGESGYGKSHAARAMLHVHPREYFMITSLTDKALFYMNADELRPGMTIFCDDAEISPGIEGIIKRSTSAFQEETEHRVPMKEGGKLTTKTLKIPPRIDWLLTSVDTQGSDQFVKRQISYGVDETDAQDEKVIAFELEKARDGLPEFPVTEDVLICREIIRHIKEDEEREARLFTVKIPFAEHIKWLDTRNRRNLPIFIDMVKGFAVLNFEQRERDSEGALIATIDDFNAAALLYNSRGGFQKLHITEREKEMLQFIIKAGGELATDELMEAMKLSDRRISQIGERLTTLLPGFSIELRSVHVKDPDDTGKSTTTRRNYYVYTGAVTVDLFGSVVSLDERPLEALGEAVEGHSKGEDFERKEAQNERPKANNPYNNNNNNNNTPEVNLRVRTQEDAHDESSLYVLRKTSSAHDLSQTEGTTKSISSTEIAEDLEQKLRVPFERSLSALRVLLVNILLAAKDAGVTVESKGLAEAVANKIKRQHSEWRDYDVLSFYKKLVENDKEIQGLIADLTGGKKE